MDAIYRAIVIDKPGIRWSAPATAGLDPIDPGHGLPPVYLVSVGDIAAQRYAPAVRAGRTIGGITRTEAGKWAGVAYENRDEWLLNGKGVGGYIPLDANDEAHAVRMLLQWWRTTHHSGNPDDLDMQVWREA